jgi:hypothetical protein
MHNGQAIVVPGDWGANLATWNVLAAANVPGPVDGTIVQTKNVGGGAFPTGQALDAWLGNVGALGQNGVPAGGLSIFSPRFNAIVGPANTPSQPWITDVDPRGAQAYSAQLSFDTPVGRDAGSSTGTCGRPAGCTAGDLSPQEKAIEFSLFNLSSCVN